MHVVHWSGSGPVQVAQFMKHYQDVQSPVLGPVQALQSVGQFPQTQSMVFL